MAILEPWILAVVLCMARLIGLFAVTPFLSPRVLTGVLRNALVIALAVILAPALMAQVDGNIHFSVSLLFVMGKEVLLGLLVGYLVSIVFWASSSIGFIVDNQRGSSMAEEADPLSGEQSSPTGNLVFQTFTMIFYSTGGFLIFMGLLFDSYVAWPVLSFMPRLDGPRLLPFFFGQLDIFMYGVILLASPAMLICFLTDFYMGMVNRFAPQLNVFFMAMPVKSALSLFLMVLYWGLLLSILKDQLVSRMMLVPLIEKLTHTVP